MTASLGATAAFVLGLAALAALPAVGQRLRAGGTERCALDGVAVAAGRRVRVVELSGEHRVFCCVDCANAWTTSSAARPAAIFVTDETTGAELRAEDAWFVRSSVVACPETGCTVHVFASRAAAQANADSFRGVLCTGDERPLRVSR